MLAHAEGLQREGVHIGLVPTMGSLHQGHLSLVGLLDGNCDVKMASIFVNPAQFAPSEDFEQYPRDEGRDIELLREAGCSLLFCPTVDQMYPQGYQTYVEVEGLSSPLCGRFRPGHFRGVATVVLKLFNLTRCSVAAFGLKDYQQAQVIKRMVQDLHLPVKLLFGETVREDDGLAMSSRNAYLSHLERSVARVIPRSLRRAQRLAAQGITSAERLVLEIKDTLTSEPELRIQYVEIVHTDTLKPLPVITDEAQALVAVYIGKTRLIDNVRLRLPWA